MVGPPGFEPGRDRLCFPLRLSPPLSGSWAGLSLHPITGVCRLVSTPSPSQELGSGSPCFFDAGFPEFGRMYSDDCSSGSPRQLIILRRQFSMNTRTNCIVCGNRLQGRKTHFCSLVCKNRHHQSYEAQQRRGLARKIELVKAAGGRCTICGYNRNLGALAFHHTQSGKKDFALDARSLSNRKHASVLAEVKKCILLCHNCHAELHYEHLNVDSLR